MQPTLTGQDRRRQVKAVVCQQVTRNRAEIGTREVVGHKDRLPVGWETPKKKKLLTHLYILFLGLSLTNPRREGPSSGASKTTHTGSCAHAQRTGCWTLVQRLEAWCSCFRGATQQAAQYNVSGRSHAPMTKCPLQPGPCQR